MKVRIYHRRCIWCGLPFSTNYPQAWRCSYECAHEMGRYQTKEARYAKANPYAYARAKRREKAARSLTWPKVQQKFGDIFSHLEAA